MKNKFFIIISIIVFLVVLPLLKPWYIFSLDQILNINWWIPKIWDNIFWVSFLSSVFSFVWIPVWVLEKIIILLTFILPIWWGYLILKDKKNIYSLLFACVLLIFNPFLYWRFIDWQINIYLSFAFYPLFFYFLREFFFKSNFKNIFFTSILTLILCLTSLHNAIFLFFIVLIFCIFYFKKVSVLNISKIVFSIFLINLLWFLPFIFSKSWEKSDLARQISHFWDEHRNVFSTDSWNLSLYFNTLSMNWYWWEREKRFVSVPDGNKAWFVIFLVIFFLGIYWIWSKGKEKKLNAFDYSLITLFFISYIFALWTSNWNIFSNLNNLMYNYFPMYSGMREPHKWIMFLVLIYAYFWAIWMEKIFLKVEKSGLDNFNKMLVMGFLTVLPIFYVPRTLFWFYWQVFIWDYPQEWQEIKQIYKEVDKIEKCKYLKGNKTERCYNAISLPWHGYIKIDFAKKVVWGWIVQYFWKNILFWDNIEIWNIYSQSTRLESKIIEKYFQPKWIFENWITKENLKEFYEELQSLWVKYIFLLKESDFKKYKEILDFSEKNKFIKTLKENSKIIFYEII